QQDVRLGQLDVLVALAALDALVVVVDGHREGLLRPMLADHVLVQHLEDLARLGQRAARRLRLLLEFLADDVVAELHAFIADEHAGAGDQLAHLVLALPAERAVEDLVAIAGTALPVFAHACAFPVLRPAGRVGGENSTGPEPRQKRAGPGVSGGARGRRGTRPGPGAGQPAWMESSGRRSRTSSTRP